MRSPEIIHEKLVQLNLHSLFLPCIEPAVPFLRQTWQLPFSLRINEHFPTNQKFTFSRNCGDVSIGKWKTKMWHGIQQVDKVQNKRELQSLIAATYYWQSLFCKFLIQNLPNLLPTGLQFIQLVIKTRWKHTMKQCQQISSKNLFVRQNTNSTLGIRSISKQARSSVRLRLPAPSASNTSFVLCY